MSHNKPKSQFSALGLILLMIALLTFILAIPIDTMADGNSSPVIPPDSPVDEAGESQPVEDEIDYLSLIINTMLIM